MKKMLFLTAVFSLVAMTYYDYALSYNAIETGRYAEGNPMAAWMFKDPMVGLSMVTISSAGISLGLVSLHKENSTLAWILTGVIFAAHAFIIYNNHRIGGHF